MNLKSIDRKKLNQIYGDRTWFIYSRGHIPEEIRISGATVTYEDDPDYMSYLDIRTGFPDITFGKTMNPLFQEKYSIRFKAKYIGGVF